MYNCNLLVLFSSLFQHKLTKLLFYNTKDIYMFSEAFTYLARSLRLARTNEPNLYTVRENLKAARLAVLKDPSQPASLKRSAARSIDEAISYTYSRTNPYPPFTSTNNRRLTPISPFQQNRQGPYGLVKGPIVPGRPDLSPTAWTQRHRESRVLTLMIQKAMNIVRRGLR